MQPSDLRFLAPPAFDHRGLPSLRRIEHLVLAPADLRPLEGGGDLQPQLPAKRMGDQAAHGQAKGKANAELSERTWNQVAADVVYRFMPNEQLFVGARYNRVEGTLLGITGDVGAKRVELGGGWFITPSVLAKATYVNQTYFGYPANSINNGGRFNGMMLEGVIAF